MQPARKVVIIGGGIAGLCTGVLARTRGYDVELCEMHDVTGGLATHWQRSGYTFETCLHWLFGCDPRRPTHALWREVFDIDKLQFIYQSEFVRVETEHGEHLSVYANVDLMEAEFLRQAPEDAPEIRRLASTVRRLIAFELPDATQPWPRRWLSYLRLLPYLPMLHQWSRISIAQYGKRFTHPLLRKFFGEGDMAELSALVLVLSLAWMSRRDAGYPIGGSQAVIRAITECFIGLGGRLRLAARVAKILVEKDAAVGVQLTDGEVIAADWVMSAADGHATIDDMLGGRYKPNGRRRGALKTFPSYLQVSFGVARDLSEQAPFVTRLLDVPLVVDPTTRLRQISFRYFHYDPTFAPHGKTAVTCFLPTRDFAYWSSLRQRDPEGYQGAKRRVAEAVIGVLERSIPGVRRDIEVTDVSTPATVIRYTGNWQGSMEGWLLTPATGFGPLPMTLPGLRRFLMVGHWVMPGGGLPSGLMTARAAIRTICREDGVRFEM